MTEMQMKESVKAVGKRTNKRNEEKKTREGKECDGKEGGPLRRDKWMQRGTEGVDATQMEDSG